MNVTEAIEFAADAFRSAGNLSPSHCDVRCTINDLTRDNPRIYRQGYDQTRAWQRVRQMLGNPVGRSEAAYYRR